MLAVAFGEEGDQVYTGGIDNSIKARSPALFASFCMNTPQQALYTIEEYLVLGEDTQVICCLAS